MIVSPTHMIIFEWWWWSVMKLFPIFFACHVTVQRGVGPQIWAVADACGPHTKKLFSLWIYEEEHKFSTAHTKFREFTTLPSPDLRLTPLTGYGIQIILKIDTHSCGSHPLLTNQSNQNPSSFFLGHNGNCTSWFWAVSLPTLNPFYEEIKWNRRRRFGEIFFYYLLFFRFCFSNGILIRRTHG